MRLNPQPRVWPRCSECKAAYVLRLGICLSQRIASGHGAGRWLWQRDCKHRKAEPEATGTLRIKAKHVRERRPR